MTPERLLGKKSLRHYLRSQMQKLGVAQKSWGAAAITQELLALPQYQEAQRVMIYVGGGWEIPTVQLIAKALEQGKTVAVPLCRPKGHLVAVQVEKTSDLAPGAYGILEPKAEASRILEPAALDLVVVPGLGFDGLGNRLGRGGGYYDRFLASLPARTVLVALAFPFQIISQIPTEPHDRPVQIIVTPQGPLSVGAS